MIDYQLLAFDVRRYLKDSDMTQQDFANESGISRSALCRFLKNKHALDPDNLCAVCDVIGKKVEDYNSSNKGRTYLLDCRDDDMPSLVPRLLEHDPALTDKSRKVISRIFSAAYFAAIEYEEEKSKKVPPLNDATYEKDAPGIWGVVEMAYPGFSHSYNIALSNDLQKIVDGELEGVAKDIFEDECESDMAKVEEWKLETDNDIYERTLEALAHNKAVMEVIKAEHKEGRL